MTRVALWLVVGVGATAVAPGRPALDPTLRPILDSLALGLLVGAAVFGLLARRAPPRLAFDDVSVRRLMARSVLLSSKSFHEEAVYRALVLGSLAIILGVAFALAVSTALFALSHVPRQGAAAATHVLTGAAFGSVYVATGRLHAAVAAHGAYNLLVGWSTLGARDLSRSDTRRRRGARLAPNELFVVEESPRFAQPTAPLVASLHGVTKSFGAVTALDRIDLQLRPGEILALLGRNGAGKTTAVATLLGLRRPDRGVAELFGRDAREPAARGSVGAVLQEIGFPPALRVRETIDLVRAHFADPVPTDVLLDRLDLRSLADRDAVALSGGQRRRLAVALALAGSPRALFLDEPTAGMDPGGRRALLRDIVDFAAGGGAVLLTTQQLAEVEEVASRIVVLVDGRVALEGTVRELRARVGLKRITLRADSVPALPGVDSHESRDGRHVFYVEDADRFVADLVRSGATFRELEVAAASLEDAFLALTENPTA